MATVSMIRFHSFIEACMEKKHNLGADTFYVQLSASPPSYSANQVEVDLPVDLATGGGYTQGGISVGVASSSSTTVGTYKLCLPDKVITASGGSIGPFRYVVLFNNTATNKELVCYFDYGADLTLQNGETLTIDFDDTNGLLTIAA